MEAAAPLPADEWGDLLLDGLPDVGLLDDLHLDYGLDSVGLPPGMDDLDFPGLDLGDGGGGPVAAGAPPTSDLLESLDLDAATFVLVSSTRAQQSPSDSGSDSPVVLPMMVDFAPPAAHATGTCTAAAEPRGGQPSPAPSESENNEDGRSDSLAATTRKDGAQKKQPQQRQKPLTDEEKRLARMLRNRENAQLSRQRKKQQVAELEARCEKLGQQNVQLAGAVQRLTAENATLRQQLMLVCQQAGRPSCAATKPVAAPAAAAKPAPVLVSGAQPAIPAAAQVGKTSPAQPAAPAASAAATAAVPTKAAQPAAAVVTPAAAGVAARDLLPQGLLLPFGLLPKVTFSAQQDPRAAGQPAAVPSAAAAAKPTQPAAKPTQRAAAAAMPRQAATPPTAARRTKRAKTAAAGASTAFLALFSLIMFAGPFAPAPLTSPGGAGTSAATSIAVTAESQRMLQALPETASALDGGSLRHAGRGLSALPAATSGSGGLAQQAPHAMPLDSSRLQQLLNSTLHALLLESGNEALETAVLQRLQELGPVALLLDADDSGAAPVSNPLAASAAFPHLAGQVFGAAGLEVPQLCQKVLEFGAASVPHVVRSRRSLERYVHGATGFRGRSLAATSSNTDRTVQPEPLRIEQQALLVGGVEGGHEEGSEARGGEERRASLRAGPSTALLPHSDAPEGSVLVSVLLPANASDSAKLASLDKVFVVLLHPQDKYATYSCALPRPVFL